MTVNTVKKITVFIDIDNTIVNFSKQIVEKLNELLSMNKDYNELKKFDFSDLFPDVDSEIKERIFYNKNFYVNIEKFQDVDRVLMEINKKFNIVFITKGTTESLQAKEKWLKNNLYSGIKYKFIGLPIFSDKTEIDMSKGIMIDDQIEYLIKSNALIKILFSDKRNETEWNNELINIDGYIVESWQEILEILMFIRKVGLYNND